MAIETNDSMTKSSDEYGASGASNAEGTGEMGALDRGDFTNHPRLNNGLEESSSGISTKAAAYAKLGKASAAAREYVGRGLEQVRSSNVVSKVQSSAREYPWYSIGLAGVSGLLLGYIVGKKALASTSVAPSYGNIEEEY